MALSRSSPGDFQREYWLFPGFPATNTRRLDGYRTATFVDMRTCSFGGCSSPNRLLRCLVCRVFAAMKFAPYRTRSISGAAHTSKIVCVHLLKVLSLSI